MLYEQRILVFQSTACILLLLLDFREGFLLSNLDGGLLMLDLLDLFVDLGLDLHSLRLTQNVGVRGRDFRNSSDHISFNHFFVDCNLAPF